MELKEKIYRFFAQDELFGKDVEQAIKRVSKKLDITPKSIISCLNQLKKEKRVDITKTGIVDLGHYENAVFKKSARSIFGRAVVKSGNEYYFSEETNAIEGDIVKIGFYFENGKKLPFISRVIERKNDIVVGHVEEKDGKLFFIPDNNKFGQRITIAQNSQSREALGKKCTLKLFLDKKLLSKSFGEIDRIFGLIGDPIVENQAIAHSKGFTKYFSEEVESEVSVIPSTVLESDFEGREDLRHLNIFTIDPATAKDLDDAVAIEKLPNGFRLYVAIADVSNYVQNGSKVDDEAYKRGTSCYLGDGVYPMLPEKLSNGICSLHEKVDRCALVSVIDIDNRGDIVSYEFKKAIINSRHKLSYETAEEIHLCQNDKHIEFADIKNAIDLMYEASNILTKNRQRRGAIDFGKAEESFKFDETKTHVVDVVDKSNLTSTAIIESFMILANEAVGKFFTEKEMGVLYRVHEAPKMEKTEKMMRSLKLLGFDYVCNFNAGQDVQRLIKEFENIKIKDYAINQLLRAMQRAQYQPLNIGHYGLGSTAYIHFTSPIRRYPDLLTHRLLSNYLEGNPTYLDEETLHRMGSYLSEQERKAQEAEIMSNKLLCAIWAEDHIGEQFEGYIYKIEKNGLTVRSGLVNVFIPKNELKDGKYGYSVEKYGALFVNDKTDNIYTIGDTISFRIFKADRNKREILATADERKYIVKPKEKVEQNKDKEEELSM